jgi:hypothetical protein
MHVSAFLVGVIVHLTNCNSFQWFAVFCQYSLMCSSSIKMLQLKKILNYWLDNWLRNYLNTQSGILIHITLNIMYLHISRFCYNIMLCAQAYTNKHMFGSFIKNCLYKRNAVMYSVSKVLLLCVNILKVPYFNLYKISGDTWKNDFTTTTLTTKYIYWSRFKIPGNTNAAIALVFISPHHPLWYQKPGISLHLGSMS